jgi:hypothetical protein
MSNLLALPDMHDRLAKEGRAQFVSPLRLGYFARTAIG